MAWNVPAWEPFRHNRSRRKLSDVDQMMAKMRRTLTGIFIAALIPGALCQKATAVPLPQRAVPTRTSELTKSRDALYDAYDQWLKQDIRLDQLLQVSPAEARKRLDDAKRANQELQGKKQQYHGQLRSEYERMKMTLGNGSADSPSAIDSLQRSYDAVLGILSEDANNIDSQMPKDATDGSSIVLKQGLEQAKRSIKDLQLTMIDQKNHTKKLQEAGEDARTAREAVTGHLNELLSRLAKYEALDNEIAKYVDNRIEAYRTIVAQNGNPCSGQNCGAEPEKQIPTPQVAGQQNPADRAQTGNQVVSRKSGTDPVVSQFAGRWRYVNANVANESKRSYPVKLCDVEIDPEGEGFLRCVFDGVPASSRSDVAFHFKVSPAGPAGSSLTGNWLEGSAAGTVTVTRKDNDKVDVTWKMKKSQQEFFVVVLYSPITLSRVQ